jgi:hypothetical protein
MQGGEYRKEVGEFIARRYSRKVLQANNVVICGNESSRNFKPYGWMSVLKKQKFEP